MPAPYLTGSDGMLQKLFDIKQGCSRCGSVLSVSPDDQLVPGQGEGSGQIDAVKDIVQVLLCKVGRQITAEDDRAVDDHIQVFYGEGKVVQIVLPQPDKSFIPLFPEKRKEVLCLHACSALKSVCRAVGLQAAPAAAVAEGALRIYADVLKSAAVHGASRMDRMSSNDGSAQVVVQKKDHGTVQSGTVPQLQIGGSL